MRRMTMLTPLNFKFYSLSNHSIYHLCQDKLAEDVLPLVSIMNHHLEVSMMPGLFRLSLIHLSTRMMEDGEALLTH